MLAAAIEAASKNGTRNCRTAVVHAAIKHGQDRRSQGFELQVLFTEFYFLREAIWRTLRKIADAPSAYDAVLPIDHALTVATRATVAGYHRQEFEQQGRWAEKVEALADEMGLVTSRTSQIARSFNALSEASTDFVQRLQHL